MKAILNMKDVKMIKEKVEVEEPESTMTFRSSSRPAGGKAGAEVTRIFLLGLQGSGKAMVGKAAAKSLSYAFVNASDSESLKAACVQDNAVIAVDPELVRSDTERSLLKESGKTLYLMGDALLIARKRRGDSPPDEDEIQAVAAEINAFEPLFMQTMDGILRAIEPVETLVENVQDALRVWNRI